MTHLVQILLPLTDNDGEPFPAGMFETLKDDLTQEFEGVTAFVQAPAEGRWAKGDATVSKEDVVIFEVMVEELRITDWRRRRSQLETSFRQDRVVIRYMAIGVV